MAERNRILVKDLRLDLENPRIRGPVASQSEALEALIDLDLDHFKTMMASISDHGLDPGDSFYVLADATESGTYIVADGNRRLSALKVLQDPALLTATNLADDVKKSLTRAAGNLDDSPIETVDVVIFPDRASADEWMDRRHGRALEGEARILWSTTEKQRIQEEESLLDVIDSAENNSGFMVDEWAAIKRNVEAKTSVLSRFLLARNFGRLGR